MSNEDDEMDIGNISWQMSDTSLGRVPYSADDRELTPAEKRMNEQSDKWVDPDSAGAITQFKEPVEGSLNLLDPSGGHFRIKAACCDEIYDAVYIRFLLPWETRFDVTDDRMPDFNCYVTVQKTTDGVPDTPTMGVLEIRNDGESLLFPDVYGEPAGAHRIEGFSAIPSGKEGFQP